MNFGRSGGTLCTVHSFDNKTKSTINGLPFREQCIKKKIFSNIQYTICTKSGSHKKWANYFPWCGSGWEQYV